MVSRSYRVEPEGLSQRLVMRISMATGRGIALTIVSVVDYKDRVIGPRESPA